MDNNYKILNTINSPDDLKKLNIESINLLADEIALYIHNTISKIGGHYSSPLGVIDLTLALHYVYNSPEDKIIWDVGHQAYSHKIITGRRDQFSNIRKINEISGFLRRDENKHDIFGAGHASTSISAALGFAHSRDKKNQNNKVLCVIGDGAMTGGMAYEALNNLGYHRTQLTIILNDNSFSISESVGALSRYLTKITTNPKYNKLRDSIWKVSGKLSGKKNLLRRLIKKTEEGIKVTLTPGGLFEELGIRYIGPIDGHDIKNLIKIFNSIKSINTPLLIHVYTDKTKRISKTLYNDAIKYYSISKPDKNLIKSEAYTFSKVFGIAIQKLSNENIFHCVTAAMKLGTGLEEFSKKYPDRYIDVGIAEEHAVTYAAALCAAGEKVIVAIYSTFMQRTYDQIIHDVALQKIPLIFCMDRSGLVGEDGPTHHGVFDISFMRHIPNIIISSPKDGFELHDLLYTALKSNKIFSIRYGKINTEYRDDYKPELLNIGQWDTLFKGTDIILLAVGSMVQNALEVHDLFKNNNNIDIGVINCRFIKPIDFKMLDEIKNKYNFIYTIEEGNISGGFGSSILEYLSENNYNKYVKLFGIKDEFINHGSRKELLDLVNLSPENIYKAIKRDYEK